MAASTVDKHGVIQKPSCRITYHDFMGWKNRAQCPLWVGFGPVAYRPEADGRMTQKSRMSHLRCDPTARAVTPLHLLRVCGIDFPIRVCGWFS